MAAIDVYFEQTAKVCVVVGRMSSSNSINIVQNDTGPKLQFTIKDCNGDVIDSGVSAVSFHLRRYCGTKTNCGHEQTSGVNVAGGVYEYCLSGGDVSAVGTYFGDVEIQYDDGRCETGFEAVRVFVRESNKEC